MTPLAQHFEHVRDSIAAHTRWITGRSKIWIEAPHPQTVAPAQTWLAATTAHPGTKGGPGGTLPDAPDRNVGWWMKASARRMAAFAELWETRPASVQFFGTERVQRLLSGSQTVRPKLNVTSSGLDWFAVSAEWEAEGLSLSDADMARLRSSSSRFVKLASGWVRRDAVEAHDAAAAENRPLDLWSILNFVNPGYLGNRSQFGVRFDRIDASPHARTLLGAKLRPVLLRRLKRDVAADLPERIEERRDCELTEGQRQLYLAELRRSRRLIDEISEDAGALRKNKITILAALTRLRQICCHPALAKGEASLGSGKFAALFELLEPLLAEGHKVLVFSQFVQCLALIEKEMVGRGIAHHKLTGETLKREAVVQAFQDDERPCVFLISLKAGGTGLNLTAASYVVLFDPWWNPAVEAQAIDRTHRIGQDRTVIAYRMLTLGTIEEKIWELQQKKSAMVRDVLGEDGFARALSRDDLSFLLQEA